MDHSLYDPTGNAANIEAVARLHRAVRTACLPYLPELHASEGGHVGRRPLGPGSDLTVRRDYCGTAAIERKISGCTCWFLRYRPDRRRKRRGLPRPFPSSTSWPVQKTRQWHGTAPGNGVGWRSQRSPASDIVSAEQPRAIGIKQSSVQLPGLSSSIILCRNASCHNPPHRTESPPSAGPATAVHAACRQRRTSAGD
jgi:hypothetical protein